MSMSRRSQGDYLYRLEAGRVVEGGESLVVLARTQKHIRVR